MEMVVKIVKKGEEEKDYHYWITRPLDERFDCVAGLLNLYFEMHPEVPRELQKNIYRIVHKNDIANYPDENFAW